MFRSKAEFKKQKPKNKNLFVSGDPGQPGLPGSPGEPGPGMWKNTFGLHFCEVYMSVFVVTATDEIFSDCIQIMVTVDVSSLFQC